MTLFVWIIFLGSIVVFSAVILVKLPDLIERAPVKIRVDAKESFAAYFYRKVKEIFRKLWHFILEAKDLTPPVRLNRQVEKMKNAFRIRVRRDEHDPDWLPEAAELAPVIEKKEHSGKPEDIFLEAIKKDPEDVRAYEGLGRLYLQEKNFSEAAETFEFLQKLNPANPVYLSNLGLCRFSLGDYRAAAAAYEQALNLNDKVSARWVNLGLCYDELAEYHKAIKAIAHALEFDPRNVGYLLLLGGIYLKVDNKIRAEKIFRQILEIDPTNRLARERLMKLKI